MDRKGDSGGDADITSKKVGRTNGGRNRYEERVKLLSVPPFLSIALATQPRGRAKSILRIPNGLGPPCDSTPLCTPNR